MRNDIYANCQNLQLPQMHKTRCLDFLNLSQICRKSPCTCAHDLTVELTGVLVKIVKASVMLAQIALK